MPKLRRSERMTDADRRRKVAKQFERRANAKRGGMLFKLGTEEYWASYDQFFEDQEGRCKICQKLWVEGSRRMHLDHDHKTMELRGLLCFSCNHKLGFVEKYFASIMAYLGYEVTD